MSDFEKIIIPLIDPKIEKGDLSPEAGFIDSYTSDPDRPSGECELFLVYDDSIRTTESINTARKYAFLPSRKNEYVKYISGCPYRIYSFWIKPDIKKWYNKTYCMSAEQKLNVLQFWGASEDISKTILSENMMYGAANREMPLNDERTPIIVPRLVLTK